jgi:monoamine oxidase
LDTSAAVGGSSLVMTAMTSWDLMAGQAGVRPVLSGRPRGAKVLILGAGVSGLVVGYELGKLGYDFRVLEARDRVGGLAWTVRRGTEHTEIGGERQVCTFDEGQYVNVGAWRIPYTHTGVLNYCKELGVPLQIFLNEADGSYFYYEGATAGSMASRRVRLREVKADLIGHTNELLVKAIDQRRLDLPLTAEDQQRLVNYLVGQGYLDSSDRAYKAFVHRGPEALRAERAPAIRIRQSAAIDPGERRHDRRADVSSGRRHGAVREGFERAIGRTASPSMPMCSPCIRATAA